MRLSDMKRTMLWFSAVLLLMGACDGDDNGAAPNGATATTAAGGGPCAVGIDAFVGERGLSISYGDQVLVASLNYETIQYCAGHDHEGLIASEADGFLWDLDDTVLTADAGSLVEIRGPGYPAATLDASLPVEGSYVDDEYGRTWLVRLPTEGGDHEVRLSLDWATGRAEYAFIAAVGPELLGPARLETARNGLQALGEDGAQVYFHLGDPAQGYGDGTGGLVYQSLHEWRWANNIDVMWLPPGATEPKVLIAAGEDSQHLQGIDAERVLTIAASQDDSNGIVPDERRVVLTDLGSGASSVLMSLPAEDATGFGRASILGDKIVVSLRSMECTWFEFIDTTGAVLEENHNPRSLAESCNPPLVTGAVLIDGDHIAYVETAAEFESEFDGNPHHYASFRQAPVQTVVISSLDTGETIHRIPIEPVATMVEWLEPVAGGVAVSLGSYSNGSGETDPSRLPILPPAPLLGDLGSDFGMDFGMGQRAGSVLITLGGDMSQQEWWLATEIDSIAAAGLCSAVLTEPEIGPPSGVTGLGIDVPITLYELTSEAERMRTAVRDAALACDYQALEALVTSVKASPAFFSGPADDLAVYWRELEDSGEYVMAILAEMLRYAPTGQNPFRWDTNRGDMSFSNATVSINADGEWVGFHVP